MQRDLFEQSYNASFQQFNFPISFQYSQYQDSNQELFPEESNPLTKSTLTSSFSLPKTSLHKQPPKPKNYKQSRLNKQSNLQQLQSRIKQIQNQISTQKYKQNYCYRCGKYLYFSGCQEQHTTKRREKSEQKNQMEFVPFNFQNQIPKLKGQIWIAIGVIMVVIGYLLYGVHGAEENLVHRVEREEVESVSWQLKERDREKVISLDMVLKNRKKGDKEMEKEVEKEVEKVEVYTDSIVTMIENSKDYAAFIHWTNW